MNEGPLFSSSILSFFMTVQRSSDGRQRLQGPRYCCCWARNSSAMSQAFSVKGVDRFVVVVVGGGVGGPPLSPPPFVSSFSSDSVFSLPNTRIRIEGR